MRSISVLRVGVSSGHGKAKRGRWDQSTESPLFVGVDGKGTKDVAGRNISREGIGVVIELDGVDVAVASSGEICGHDGFSVV